MHNSKLWKQTRPKKFSHLLTDFSRHWSKLWGQCISGETLHTVDERLGCCCTCFSVVIRHVTRKHLKGKVRIIQLRESVPWMKHLRDSSDKTGRRPALQTKPTSLLHRYSLGSSCNFPFPWLLLLMDQWRLTADNLGKEDCMTTPRASARLLV